ncbi:MAG: hypothetical protein OEY84_01815 [Rhodospirillaceae bacterium]|nr:hypothetical protein [Rhodospirillaceae bacterium]
MTTRQQIVEGIVHADKIRRLTNISKIQAERRLGAKRDTGGDALDAEKKKFLESEFSEEEYDLLRRKIVDAAKQGKYEVEIMRFPSGYCSDGGRAINNSEKEWPLSLQGKAHSFYVLWKEHGHPQGYRLMARINDYPGGFIGEISLLIGWH